MNSNRIELIKNRLEKHFQILEVEVEDESHKHAGHAGARDGRGHFRLTIQAPEFNKLSLIQRHRLIYDSLGDLMTTDIHALRIKAHGTDD